MLSVLGTAASYPLYRLFPAGVRSLQRGGLQQPAAPAVLLPIAPGRHSRHALEHSGNIALLLKPHQLGNIGQADGVTAQQLLGFLLLCPCMVTDPCRARMRLASETLLRKPAANTVTYFGAIFLGKDTPACTAMA